MPEDTPNREPSPGPLGAAAKLLGVDPAEQRSVALMLLHSFAMGLTTVFFETAATALFLERFDSRALPWVYLAAAGASATAGMAYTRLQRRLSFHRLMAGTLGFLLLTTLGLRGGLALSAAAWLPFALMVWYRVVSILTDLEYWAVAARIYDVRQAKRLFSVVGSGEVVARIAGAFSVNLLLRFTAVADLLLLSAAALVACLAILRGVLSGRTVGGADAEAAPAGGGEGPIATLRRVLASRYLRLLVSIAFLAVLAKYFVDFAFLAQIQGEYGSARELAAFFALFSGATQTLSLLIRLLVAGRVLSRYGVRSGLLLLPASQLACTGLLVACGAIPAAAGAVFWLVIANQGIYKTIKHPLDNPSFKILYQPLRRSDRLAAQIAIETIVNPIAIAVAGLVMFQFTVVMEYDATRFALVLLVTFIVWVIYAQRGGKAYAAALIRALRGRLKDINYSFTDARNVAVLRETLTTGRPREVLFALDLLERAGGSSSERTRTRRPAALEPGEPPPAHPPQMIAEHFHALLLELLAHDSAEVRLAVLHRLAKRGTPAALPAVERRAKLEKAPALRGAALRTLCALGGPETLDRVEAHLDSPDPQLRLDALIGLLGRGRGHERLEALVGSSDPADRRRAARVLSELTAPGFSEPLRRLLGDPDREARRMALVAAGRRREPGLWIPIMEALRQPRFAGVAANALVAGGEAVVGLVETSFAPERDPRLLRRLARVLGRIGGPEAKAVLLKRIAFPEEVVRHRVLEALLACGFRAAGAEADTVSEQIRAEVADAAWSLAAGEDLAGEPRLQLLQGSLEAEVERNRERLFLLLAFLYDADTILKARDNRAHESRDKRAYALEILDVTLSAELKALVMPLLDDRPKRLERLEVTFPQPRAGARERLVQLLERGAATATPWTRACATDAAARLSALELAARVATLASTAPDPLVREAAESARLRLARSAPGDASAAGSGREPMNIIEKVLTLKSVDMFSLASEEVLADIAAILEEVETPAGDVIISKGEVGDSMYIIIEGRVRVFDGDRTIARLGERDIFGELALLDPEPRFASIAAESDTHLFRLDREAFLELMAGNIEIVRGILHVLCKRLRRSVRSLGPY